MERAQIHTLEAFIAALLLVGALFFASQATAVTPLSASTSNQHIENQQQQMADDLLAITADTGDLQAALTHWNESNEHDAHFAHADPERGTYSSLNTDPEPHPLAPAFEHAFDTGVYAYNIDVRFMDDNGGEDATRMVDMGTPSDNAVTSSRTVTLFEDDRIWNTSESTGPTLKEVGESDDFWAPPVSSDGAVYNVVEVRVTVWRM